MIPKLTMHPFYFKGIGLLAAKEMGNNNVGKAIAILYYMAMMDPNGVMDPDAEPCRLALDRLFFTKNRYGILPRNHITNRLLVTLYMFSFPPITSPTDYLSLYVCSLTP